MPDQRELPGILEPDLRGGLHGGGPPGHRAEGRLPTACRMGDDAFFHDDLPGRDPPRGGRSSNKHGPGRGACPPVLLIGIGDAGAASGGLDRPEEKVVVDCLVCGRRLDPDPPPIGVQLFRQEGRKTGVDPLAGFQVLGDDRYHAGGADSDERVEGKGFAVARACGIRGMVFQDGRILRVRAGIRLHPAGGLPDRGPNPGVGGASAEVFPHGPGDGRIVRVGRFPKQGCGLEDLAGLAPAALGHLGVDPGLLDGMVPGDAFDGEDLLARRGLGRDGAGRPGLSGQENGASPAKTPAASEFCSGQAQNIPENPEKRHIRRHVHRESLSVHKECRLHFFSFPGLGMRDWGLPRPPPTSKAIRIGGRDAPCGHLPAGRLSIAVAAAFLQGDAKAHAGGSDVKIPRMSTLGMTVGGWAAADADGSPPRRNHDKKCKNGAGACQTTGRLRLLRGRRQRISRSLWRHGPSSRDRSC